MKFFRQIQHAVFCVVFITGLAAAQPDLKDCLCDYRGTLNGDKIIGLALIQAPDRSLHGSYFYKKYLKDIPLKGEFTAERDIELHEFDESGAVRATFHLHFAENDPAFKGHLNQEVLAGIWVSKSRTYPVRLTLSGAIFVSDENQRYVAFGVEDKTAFEHEVEKFYFAVLKGNKEAAMRQVKYPLRVFVLKKKLMIRSKAESLRHWNEIFTPEYVACIAKGIPHNMFARDQGAMIGNGEVCLMRKAAPLHSIPALNLNSNNHF